MGFVNRFHPMFRQRLHCSHLLVILYYTFTSLQDGNYLDLALRIAALFSTTISTTVSDPWICFTAHHFHKLHLIAYTILDALCSARLSRDKGRQITHRERHRKVHGQKNESQEDVPSKQSNGKQQTGTGVLQCLSSRGLAPRHGEERPGEASN